MFFRDLCWLNICLQQKCPVEYWTVQLGRKTSKSIKCRKTTGLLKKPLYWLKMASGHNIIYWWQNESISPKLFLQSDLCQDSDIKQCIIGNIMIEKNYFLLSRLWRIDMGGWGKQIPWYQILHRWIKFPWCTFPRLSSSHIINTDPTTIECFSQEVA